MENDSFDGTPEVFNALSAKWTADAPERRSTRLISFQSGGAQKKDLALLAKVQRWAGLHGSRDACRRNCSSCLSHGVYASAGGGGGA